MTAVTVLMCMCGLHRSHAFGTISPARSTGLSAPLCFDCTWKAHGRASQHASPRLGLPRSVAPVAATSSPHSRSPSSCSVHAVSPPAPRARMFCSEAHLHICMLICMSTRTHATGHVEPCVRTHSQRGSMVSRRWKKTCRTSSRDYTGPRADASCAGPMAVPILLSRSQQQGGLEN